MLKILLNIEFSSPEIMGLHFLKKRKGYSEFSSIYINYMTERIKLHFKSILLTHILGLLIGSTKILD